MVGPTGEQFEISAAGYRAVVTEGGATLRLLEHEGRSVVDGFAEDAMPVCRARPAADALAEPDP